MWNRWCMFYNLFSVYKIVNTWNKQEDEMILGLFTADIKGIVQPKMKIMSSFTQPHVVS